MARVFTSRGAMFGVAGVLIVLAMFWAVRFWATLSSVERAGDPVAAALEIEAVSDEDRAEVQAAVEEQDVADATLPEEEPAEPYQLPATENPFAISPPLPDDMFEAILLIGADASGLRADAIILVLLADDSPPILVSIPRDLYVENPCTNRYNRVNSNLFGCGDDVSGGELLSLAVSRFTGVGVDHFALVDFEGFADAVDAVGGIEWCFEYPVRDVKAELDAPAGCQVLDGEAALAWARSRKTLEFRDGAWRGTGASDFSRQEHQQGLLFALLRKVASFSNLGALQSVAETAVDAVSLSEDLSVSRAVGLAWEYRRVRPDDIVSISLQADPYVTSAGAWVLQPTVSFNELLAEVYPAAFVPVALGE